MQGPMDEAIEPTPSPQDKARKRLDEFVSQRYPGGVPPANAPVQDEPTEDSRGKRKNKDRPAGG